MLDQGRLARTMFPVGGLQKSEVRELATELDLRTAAKPDSQDVCFITSDGGRTAFLGDRIPFRPGNVVDTAGRVGVRTSFTNRVSGLGPFPAIAADDGVRAAVELLATLPAAGPKVAVVGTMRVLSKRLRGRKPVVCNPSGL